ncbi:hypothetical protein HPP92_012180 [Vanilla planifolia]|uniref:Uncharacterized protein n=1 Tax=Vanilla planifolia TaxID=51239 RepID=A0A835R785_VANPL|nr:hypothetical protein HPP92_012180 [Vanilla planifolia]
MKHPSLSLEGAIGSSWSAFSCAITIPLSSADNQISLLQLLTNAISILVINVDTELSPMAPTRQLALPRIILQKVNIFPTGLLIEVSLLNSCIVQVVVILLHCSFFVVVGIPSFVAIIFVSTTGSIIGGSPSTFSPLRSYVIDVVAVGECGLDYDRLCFCPSNTQKKYFVKQFELAETLQLSMFLHMHAAAEDFFSILTQNRHRFTSGVVHSFTGSSEDCLNGCSLKTIENLNVVKGIPIERMMLETDSPYCEIKNSHAGIHYVRSNWPSKRKEKYDPDCTVKGRNEPCLIRQVLEVVASCRGISSVDQLSRTLYYNTCRLFFPHEVDAQADALLEISSEVPEEKA